MYQSSVAYDQSCHLSHLAHVIHPHQLRPFEPITTVSALLVPTLLHSPYTFSHEDVRLQPGAWDPSALTTWTATPIPTFKVDEIPDIPLFLTVGTLRCNWAHLLQDPPRHRTLQRLALQRPFKTRPRTLYLTKLKN